MSAALAEDFGNPSSLHHFGQRAKALIGMATAIRLNFMLGGQPDVPVAEGAQAPFDGHAFPTSWRESTDKRFGIALPTNPNGPSSMTAAKMLSSAIRGATNPILVATGPLTNIAQAFMDEDGELICRLGPEKLETGPALGGLVVRRHSSSVRCSARIEALRAPTLAA
jgi:hypothetical protein